MRIKPVLFNTPMVRALLTGQKTATRRVVKPVPPQNARLELVGDMRHAMDLSIEIPGPDDHRIYTPPYLPGDILYVREAWAKDGKSFTYRADAANRGSAAYYLEHKAGDTYNRGIRWHPSIHMPKEAARIWLRVTDVLRSSFRSADDICRLKADEFVIIMTRMTAPMHTYVYEKISQVNAVLQQPQDELPPLSLSVGVAFSDRENPEGDIFQDADSALMRMKKMRNTGCSVY